MQPFKSWSLHVSDDSDIKEEVDNWSTVQRTYLRQKNTSCKIWIVSSFLTGKLFKFRKTWKNDLGVGMAGR